jgi:hypothetical protein
MRLRTRDLEAAFTAYERAAREHAFVHAAVTQRIRAGETPTTHEIDAVNRAHDALDEARRHCRAVVGLAQRFTAGSKLYRDPDQPAP